MASTTPRPSILGSGKLRWAVPVAVATLVAATAVAAPLIADADGELPERSAGELVASIAHAGDVPFAGTIVHSADVGLPELSGLTDDASSPLALLSGATTARVWYSDATTFRIAVYGDLSETDLIRDGDELWYWNSEQNTVYRVPLEDLPDKEVSDAGMPSLPPEMMAEFAIRLLEPSTHIEVDGTATVAGRSAYELVLSPRDERSRIGSVRVAVDGEHGVPLRVRIYSTDGGDPAVEVGFTSISFAEPDRSVFEFTPPPGADVQEPDTEEWLAEDHHGAPGKHGEVPGVDVDVIGEGWTSILAVSGLSLDELLASAEEHLADSPGRMDELTELFEALLGQMRPVSGSYGEGMAFETSLWSVLWLDDGRFYAGAVSLDVLEEAAGK